MEHPITPTSELAQQWYDSIPSTSRSWKQELATQAARWGDEQRLEACIAWLHYNYPSVNCAALRAAMRPKPPSLAEQALALLNHDPDNQPFLSEKGIAILRHALERLQELEKGNEATIHD